MLWIKCIIGFTLWLATASAFLSLFGVSDEREVERMLSMRERKEKEAA